MNEWWSRLWRTAGSEVEFVSPRLVRVRLRHFTHHITIIAVYAPTSTCTDEDNFDLAVRWLAALRFGHSVVLLHL